MAMARPLLALTILTFSLLSSPSNSETHTDCGVAQTAFSFCVAYAAGLDRRLPPKCCMGVRAVQELMSASSLGQRGMCECLKQEMVAAGAVSGPHVAGLSRKCGVTTNFMPTSLDYDCNSFS